MSELTTITMPYLVDDHVHCRTPEQEYKEDFGTATEAALAGGVIEFIDMPNNKRLIDSLELLLRKMEIAQEQAHCYIRFYLGTLGNEDQDFASCEPYVSGLKIYMSNTTGGYIVTDPFKLESIFRRWESSKPILVHAEGDTLAVAIALAEKYHRRLHVCHVSLAEEVRQIAAAKSKRPDYVTCEVTPHHLFESDLWSADPFHKMKPPLSGFADIQALWQAVVDGVIDVFATDHAPHTELEKLSENPPFGVTGLETMLALLLMAERAGKITLEQIIQMTHRNPIAIFGLVEHANSYIEVLRGEQWEIRGKDLKTRAQITPFEGKRPQDKVQKVVIEGEVVYEAGKVLNEPGSGKVLPLIRK